MKRSLANSQAGTSKAGLGGQFTYSSQQLLPGNLECLPPCGRFHNKGVYVRVGLQKISHSRSLHKEIRLQVEQQEVELPSIEGLIFINIPRCWGWALKLCSLGQVLGLCLVCT